MVGPALGLLQVLFMKIKQLFIIGLIALSASQITSCKKNKESQTESADTPTRAHFSKTTHEKMAMDFLRALCNKDYDKAVGYIDTDSYAVTAENLKDISEQSTLYDFLHAYDGSDMVPGEWQFVDDANEQTVTIGKISDTTVLAEVHTIEVGNTDRKVMVDGAWINSLYENALDKMSSDQHALEELYNAPETSKKEEQITVGKVKYKLFIDSDLDINDEYSEEISVFTNKIDNTRTVDYEEEILYSEYFDEGYIKDNKNTLFHNVKFLLNEAEEIERYKPGDNYEDDTETIDYDEVQCRIQYICNDEKMNTAIIHMPLHVEINEYDDSIYTYGVNIKISENVKQSDIDKFKAMVKHYIPEYGKDIVPITTLDKDHLLYTENQNSERN